MRSVALCTARRGVALTTAQRGVRRLSTKLDDLDKGKAPPIETSLSGGILTITFANERKLNAWTQPMMTGFFEQLDRATAREDVAGVVVTGQGKYYSAGVDLSNIMKPMMPSKLVCYLRDMNQQVFERVIDFPKPIVTAVNGPALGAAVTTATLMDCIVASESATFSLPFSKLGVPPEGARRCAVHTTARTRRMRESRHHPPCPDQPPLHAGSLRRAHGRRDGAAYPRRS